MPTIKKSAALLRKTTSKFEISIQSFPKRKKILEETLSNLVGLRLTDPGDKNARAYDSFALREFEKSVLTDESNARGVPYEGLGLMLFYRDYIEGSDSLCPELNIVVTDRLVMSWSNDDVRYHARVAVFGIPCMISMSGLVEAPAKPREYYLAKQAIESIGGKAGASLAKQFSGRFLESDDERTPGVLKGYLLQCIFFAMTGEPFCIDRDCSLYNAHWQEEMIHAQVESGKLCRLHRDMLDKLES